jgi:DNA polymerase I-like protein with 3'-5' exonuclease and polymerase domains
VALAKANGVRVIGQFHDEIAVATPDPEETCRTLDMCCVKLNEKLKLNVQLGIDYSVGDTYSEVH